MHRGGFVRFYGWIFFLVLFGKLIFYVFTPKD